MNTISDKLILAFYIILLLKILVLGEFNVFVWIRYGREYRLWYSSRETFGEYMKRMNRKKVGW